MSPTADETAELPFSDATRMWFTESFAGPTPVQTDGWQEIASGHHALLLAPTGSGKTLAAFLWALDRCFTAKERVSGVRVLYISPLKALAHDIERNLRAPLAGITNARARLGEEALAPRVAVRTGDTPQSERRAFQRDPAEILVTTPESLYLMLGSEVRSAFRTLETVIVDEVHALVPTKRGAHLMLSLERLAALAESDPQRIGLSATARPLATVAGFLGGERPVAVVDTSAKPALDLRIALPIPDLSRPPQPQPQEPRSGQVIGTSPFAPRAGVWPVLETWIFEEIIAHRTTIVFVNSRGLCERLSQRLNDLFDERQETDEDGERKAAEFVRAHHGSLSHTRRKDTEEALKTGALRGIVATSSLELGVDMAAVDHVILVESPGTVASGLQRIGRAGHGVGQTSRGAIVPKHRGDLLESIVIARRMREGEIEELSLPERPLDVLAQHIVAMCSVEPLTVGALEELVKRSVSFRDLSRELLTNTLDLLAGSYSAAEFAELRPRIVWDRRTDELRGRRGSKMLALVNGGTIPDRGLFPVHLGPEGPRVGELDEEMVHESRAGHVIALGASSWRVLEISRDRVIVEPAPGEPGRLPFWRGDGPGRPVALGRALGAFVREIGDMSQDDARAALKDAWHLDDRGVDNVLGYLREQREVTGRLPHDRALVIERFRDELGDLRICILSPFGARVHAPWALGIEAALQAAGGDEVQALWNDDGIIVRFPDGPEEPVTEELLPDPDEIEELVVERLADSSLFAGAFRENAARSLVLPRQRPGKRTPLWVQRLRSKNLLEVAQRHPAFPVLLETYRTCLRDIFDVPAVISVLRDVRSHAIDVTDVDTKRPSPFARSLSFDFTAAHFYGGDVPAAERRAQSLALDRDMLRELLGNDDLRDLLDADSIAAVEFELQRLDGDRGPRDADGLHDLLRELGDLEDDELAARGIATDWLGALIRDGRALSVRIAGSPRHIAVEDAASYRDALGVALPPGVIDAFLAPSARPLRSLVLRYARTHGPFPAADVAVRFGLAPGVVEEALMNLTTEGSILKGAFRPGGAEIEWCHDEVLKRIRRRALARLRSEIEPVDGEAYGRFLHDWHDLGGARGRGAGDALFEAVCQLEGVSVSLAELEGAFLPARLPDYDRRALDMLMSGGAVVWIADGPVGKTDARVRLYRREQVPLLRTCPSEVEQESSAAGRLLDHLRARGASFFSEITSALRDRHTMAEIEEGLWELVWRGLITNDTLDPLRRRGHTARRTRRVMPPSGRWSLVSQMHFGEQAATAKAHAVALNLLERWGVVGRACVQAEELPGGFAGIYGVLREMEDAGRARRGWFVDGLEGAQFSLPGAVDRLRAARHVGDEPRASCLAANDPANPWGTIFPWPENDGARPRRAVGCRVVLVDGACAVFVTKGGKRVTTYPAMQRPEAARIACEALLHSFREGGRRRARIDTIDGEPATTSPLAETFLAAGFESDWQSLIV